MCPNTVCLPIRQLKSDRKWYKISTLNCLGTYMYFFGSKMYRQFNNQPYGVFYCRLYLTEIDFFSIPVSESVTSHTYSFNSTFFCHALTFLFPFLLALGESEPFLPSSHGLTSCWSECETAAPWNMMPLSNMPSSFLSQPQFFFIFLPYF